MSISNAGSSSWPAARRVVPHFAPVRARTAGTTIARPDLRADLDPDAPTEDFVLTYFRDDDGEAVLRALVDKSPRGRFEQWRQYALELKDARLEREAEASRISQEAAKSRQAELDHSKAEDLRAFMGVVDASFDRLSAGDLTVRMSDTVAPEFEPIKAKFNASVEELERAHHM